jgi:hypothetical protein
MLAVLGRPPQNAALRSRLRQDGQSKLKDPTSSECAVGKVSVTPVQNIAKQPRCIAMNATLYGEAI